MPVFQSYARAVGADLDRYAALLGIVGQNHPARGAVAHEHGLPLVVGAHDQRIAYLGVVPKGCPPMAIRIGNPE